MKTILATAAILIAFAIGAQAMDADQQPVGMLGGLSANEWQGCGVIHTAIGLWGGPDPSYCGVLRDDYSRGDLLNCVSASIANRKNIRVETSDKRAVYVGCAMLVKNVNKETAEAAFTPAAARQ